MGENKKKHFSEITKEEFIDIVKGLNDIFGVTLDTDELIDSLFDNKPKKRKVRFKIKSKKRKVHTLNPDEDILFEWLARKNGVHKDLKALNEYQELQQCFKSLTPNQLLISGLISLNDEYFEHLTDEKIKEYYLNKFEIFHEGNYSFEHRDFNKLSRAEKILIKIFYDELH